MSAGLVFGFAALWLACGVIPLYLEKSKGVPNVRASWRFTFPKIVKRALCLFLVSRSGNDNQKSALTTKWMSPKYLERAGC